MRAWYENGMSLTEIGSRCGLNKSTVYRFLKDKTPSDEWPLTRPDTQRERISRAMLRNSVDPTIIIGEVQEYCDDHGITLSEFARRYLGVSSGGRLYRWRAGTRLTMSRAYAMKLDRLLVRLRSQEEDQVA